MFHVKHFTEEGIKIFAGCCGQIEKKGSYHMRIYVSHS